MGRLRQLEMAKDAMGSGLDLASALCGELASS
jgi:hypothetical protein